ncbi:sugar ABC transporter ATPase [Microbacterium sp.]|uniref:sugar ABC transporter ATPase n=1 Tax=Microbacterium sp. TaxID=51671 RepID=UPI0025E2793C|nr:sugar ABC transporter ATPase [Microbacterium sp.]MBT9607294.1 sugar ABC transporter ATPase [Microbacterium sp.]
MSDASIDPAETDLSVPTAAGGAADAQPLRDGDTSVEADPSRDPAQAEWDATTALDEGVDPADLDPATATGADPAEIPAEDSDIPLEDLHPTGTGTDSQGQDPGVVELGDEGQGDLAPEDL